MHSILEFPTKMDLEPTFTNCSFCTVSVNEGGLTSESTCTFGPEQGQIGDCFLIAALQFCNSVFPKEWWKKLLQPLMHTAFKVVLLNHHVFVNTKFPILPDGNPVGIDFRKCLWGALLENAYLIYLSKTEPTTCPLHYSTIDAGGLVEDVVRLFALSIGNMYTSSFRYQNQRRDDEPCFRMEEWPVVVHGSSGTERSVSRHATFVRRRKDRPTLKQSCNETRRTFGTRKKGQQRRVWCVVPSFLERPIV